MHWKLYFIFLPQELFICEGGHEQPPTFLLPQREQGIRVSCVSKEVCHTWERRTEPFSSSRSSMLTTFQVEPNCCTSSTQYLLVFEQYAFTNLVSAIFILRAKVVYAVSYHFNNYTIIDKKSQYLFNILSRDKKEREKSVIFFVLPVFRARLKNSRRRFPFPASE